MLSLRLCLNKRGDGSHRNFDNGFRDGSGDWFAVLFQALKIALNGVPYVRHCFITGFPLRDAAGQSWTLSDKNTVLIGLNCNSKLHAPSLAIG
jgi:hypothetical protein